MSCPTRTRTSGSLPRPRFSKRSPAIAALAASVALSPLPAAAQFDLGLGAGPRPWFDLRNVFTELRLVPSVSAGVTYTDNVDFEAEGREDFFVFLRPRVSLVARARRLNTALDYAFSLEYSTDEGGFRIEQISDSALRSANSFELVDNILFLEADASISREIIDNTITTPGGVESEQTDNFATVQRYLLRPILRYQFGNFLVTESTASVGYVDTGEADDTTVTYGLSHDFIGGPRFSTYQWSWRTEYLSSQSLGGGDGGGEFDEDDDDFSRFTTTFNSQIVITPEFSLLGSVGYEQIEEDTLSDEPDGLIWDVGFAAQPNRRTSIRATVGRRFDDETYSADVRYEIGAQSVLTLQANRTLQTEETLFLNDLSFLGFNDQGEFIDTRTGLPPQEDISLFGLEDEVFFTDRVSANLVLSRRRNSYVFDAFYIQREVQEIDAEDDTETVLGGGGRWTRQLSRDMSGTLSLEYRNTEFGGNEAGREDDLITFRSGLSRDLGQGFSGSFNYVFRRQMSTFDEEDITENAVTLSVTKTF